MLKKLQITCLAMVGLCFASISIWRYFTGTTSWLIGLSALLGYGAFLSTLFLGSPDAWHKRFARFLFERLLATVPRTVVALVLSFAVLLISSYLAYEAIPPGTDYYEVRVFDKQDSPSHYMVGSDVIIHVRTNGLTYVQKVDELGGALFRELPSPTNIVYQVNVTGVDRPFTFGDSRMVDRLPDLLQINLANIPDENRELMNAVKKPAKEYVIGAERYLDSISSDLGSKNLQLWNAPWGVPAAAITINRLGYTMGYDTAHKAPFWVAYCIGPTTQQVERLPFTPDPAIDSRLQAGVEAYRGSGYDRGHLISPSDLFFGGPVMVAEANYMSTIVPQNPRLNRTLWLQAERIARDKVTDEQIPAYIIAGPVYPEHPATVNGLYIPSHFFRITMMAKEEGLELFSVIVPNEEPAADASLDSFAVSIQDVEEITGMHFIPLFKENVDPALKTEVRSVW